MDSRDDCTPSQLAPTTREPRELLTLRPLVVGDRVAHQEDMEWRAPSGTVIEIEPTTASDPGYVVRWDSGDVSHHGSHDVDVYHRWALVVLDDPDNIEETT